MPMKTKLSAENRARISAAMKASWARRIAAKATAGKASPETSNGHAPSNGAAPVAPVPAPGMPTHSPSSGSPYNANQILALAIVKQYRKGKRTDWSAAFAEHPEWEKQLLSVYETRQNISSSVTALLREHAKHKKSKHKSTYVPVAQRRAAAAAASPAEPTAPTLNLCPCCGFPIAALIKAFNALVSAHR